MERRLLLVIAACAAAFVTALVYVNVVGDIRPEWLWGFVMAALIVPPVVAVIGFVLVLHHRRRARLTGP